MSELESILLIHIEEIKIRSEFYAIFKKLGFQLYQVNTIEEAEELLISKRIDIIVLNMDIGYQESFKFCHKIKQNIHLKNIYVIGLTDAHERFGIYLNARTKAEKSWLNLDLLVHKPTTVKNIYKVLKKEVAILEKMDTTKLDSELDYLI